MSKYNTLRQSVTCLLVYIILGFPPPVCLYIEFVYSVSLIVCVVVVLFVCCCCFCVCGFCVFSGSFFVLFFCLLLLGMCVAFCFVLSWGGWGGGGLRLKQDDKRQDHRELHEKAP